jgi:hypothetical protein
MTVTLSNGVAVLSGKCGLDDVEVLLGHLQTTVELKVDLRHAEQLHGAVLQLLLVFEPSLAQQAGDPFVRLLTAGLASVAT